MSSDRKVWEFNMGATQPLGHTQVTVTSTVAVVTPPAGTRRITFRTVGQPINFTDDGVNPTASTGFPLFANEVMVHDVDEPKLILMYLATGATADADVRIMYHGNGA